MKRSELLLGVGLVLAVSGAAMLLGVGVETALLEEAPVAARDADAPASSPPSPEAGQRAAEPPTAPAENAPPVVLAWRISPQPERGDLRRFDVRADPAVFRKLHEGQEVRFPLPGSELRFKVLLHAIEDARPVEHFASNDSVGVKVTGLNGVDAERQTLDMVIGPHRAIGSIEDGDKLYAFMFSKDGKGELVVMPDRPAPRALME